MPERERLLKEVRRALAHLDDPLHLENLELARQLASVTPTPDLSKGQVLRRTLHLAIASLDPSVGPAAEGMDTCCYQVLYRYAISKRSMVAIADELGISERKGYYDLQRATEALAYILSDLLGSSPPVSELGQGGSLSPAGRVRRELARLAGVNEQDVELNHLVAEALKGIAPLAEKHEVRVLLQKDAAQLRVAANRVLLRQAILNLLSYMVTLRQDSDVHLTLQRSAQEAVVALSCVAAPDREPISPESPYGVAAQILETLGLDWRRIDDRGSVRIALHIPLSQQRTILVVDDNEGLLALFRRYLRNQPYLVCTARDGEEVQAILAQTRPDVTILDIMLPNQDGWEILQLLRSRVAPHQTRVIICSIINDPELAQALGADAFLHKPVPRAQLLRTLNQVLVSVA